ncbi:MAG: electron transfer flavoprotein subunit alpha/FixB family protein [Odoribacteraceae bacterium]|jgi:electron transfer flavoprotein alpha subunit|nr:electron transfer flavoprotein subunit alpha/FixB family protein [Odoribacteraceae bacterium]
MDKSEYKHVFVFAEQREGVLQPVAIELLGKARELAAALHEKVVAVLLGDGVEEAATRCVAHGADTVILAGAPELATYATEPYAQALYSIATGHRPAIFLFGATTIGRDLAPRLSARLDTGLTADCTALDISPDGDLLMTRPAFGGNLMATILCKEHRPQMSTVRPGVMRPGDRDDGRVGTIERVSIPFDRSRFRTRLLRSTREEKERVDITAARVLVSGGRGAGDAAGFRALDELARVLGAEVSSSRAVVDAGIVPRDRQVGQTGKTVRPDLYIAAGISGAIQHLAGMDESGYIIAINTDKSAPIFQVADLGIVGDVSAILPLLTARLRALREKRNHD